MLGTVIVILLALVLLAYVAVPLLLPGQSDPLPDARDPVLQELEEEKGALFRAIRELELREDLAEARRAELRARYEAKAARVLRALDERQAQLAGTVQHAPPKRTRRVPVVALSLLGVMGVTALVMSGYVLPRVGADATVTTGDLEAGRQLRDLQREAERDPSEDKLLALADAYWQLGEAEAAQTEYEQVVATFDPAPAAAYQRLGLLSLQSDIAQAQDYLERARALEPTDLDTLYYLAEIYFAQAQPEQALETMRAYLAQPGGAGDEQAQARLEVMTSLAPALRRATDDPSEENLLALADAYWGQDERERAADIYLRVLSSFDPHQSTALSRVGQVLFFSGRTDEAVELLLRARELDDTNLDTLLFLGNAYFTQERFEDAIDAWERYIEVAGGPGAAGRVPSLIESARARLDATTASADGSASGSASEAPATVQQVSGGQLFAANCATCHGVGGAGGSGPRLVGSARARDAANVQDAIRYGRGTMPGFGARLGDAEIAALTDYVVNDLGADREANR